MNMKILLGAAMVALCAMTSAAFAGDAKVYNGSYCDIDVPIIGPVYRTDRGFLNYSSESYIGLVCPVLQDSTSNTNGTLYIFLRWSEGNGSSGKKLWCLIYSKNYNGTTRQSQYASATSGGTLVIPNITSDHLYGSYVLYCALPPKATLHTIFVQERS